MLPPLNDCLTLEGDVVEAGERNARLLSVDGVLGISGSDAAGTCLAVVRHDRRIGSAGSGGGASPRRS